MPVKNRIFFIFGFYRFLKDVTRWVGTSLWGITLRPIYGVRVADAEGTRSAAYSDLRDDFIPASAAKMVFCTAGLERFPR